MARQAKPATAKRNALARRPEVQESVTRSAGRIDQSEARTDVLGAAMKGMMMNAKIKDTMDQFTARGAEFAQKGYDQMFGSSREQLEKASVTALKSYEELSKFQKDNYDAYVAASTILAKGAENFGKAWFAYTQESLETAAQTAKALLGAKTLREAVDLQSDFAKTSFDKLVSEGTKLSELSVKVANEAFAPINARVNVAVEKLTKPVAVA